VTSSPAALPPVRPLTLSDLRACLDLAVARGWTREERKWRLLLSAGRGYGVDAPAGDPHGGLIATVVLTSYTAPVCHAVGMVLTAERYERRGLATRLMRHVIEVAAGTPLFLTATDMGQAVYERLGFKSVGQVTTLRGSLAPGATPPPGLAVRPATAADLPAVLAYDRPVFGADRTELITRLPAYADRFLVAERDGRLAGFGARWENVASMSLGPVAADDPAVARALLTALAAGSPLPVRLDLDSRTPGLDTWVRANGLSETGRTAVMVLGAPDTPGDPARRVAPFTMAHG
jgi:GNAT superfamily N-acetyltransferase